MPPRRAQVHNQNEASNESQNSVGPEGQPPPPPPPPQPERNIEKEFRKECPPLFDGMGDPAKAETWIRAIERIFKFLRCTDQECLSCVIYQLSGSAEYWWETKQRTMSREQLDALTWENFKEELYDKYIPRSYRKAKEAEFYNMKQGRMTVTEYDRALCDMSRYAPEQEAMPREKTVTPTTPTPPTPQQNFRDKRKWDGNREPFDNKRFQGTPNSARGKGKQATLYQSGECRQRAPLCANCQRNHLGECRVGTNVCYKCGGVGHFAKECPSSNNAGYEKAT
ncbi:uncharacterized protein LOC121804146 [Salvia splendens]|uniref:uncharacterized protein LOC121804146 n=1 Tax=Salvia splendens TaxID=180675 RepID=UPI001C2687A4|nr:uncharacterized protein LOC121804146 [Salvia splendens]